MLKAYAWDRARLAEVAPDAGNVVWFDLLSPTPEERAMVVRISGLSLPTEADLNEIESSSRLSSDGPVLTLSMPLASRTPEGPCSNAIGFVLAPERMVTLRFAPSVAVDRFVETTHENGRAQGPISAYIFVGLLEVFVDRQADALERLRDELDVMSHQIFRHRLGEESGRGRRNQESELQTMLVTLGRSYDVISFLRDSQLGIARIAPFVQATATWLPKPAGNRLSSVHKDINSLNEFTTHLTDKVQFLLDATLGLINVSQNKLIKVLTVVSIVGIPPTLIAGIYGMNFKYIPELSWTYGYPYAWAAMIVSAILPLLLFRLKGWL